MFYVVDVKYAWFQSAKNRINAVVSGNDLQIVCNTFAFQHTVAERLTWNWAVQHMFLNFVTFLLSQLVSLLASHTNALLQIISILHN